MEDRAISLNDIKEAMGILKTECELQIAENDTKSRLLISDLFCKMLEIIGALPHVTPQRPKWIETGDVGYIEDTAIYEFQCSKCKSLAYFRKSFNEIVGGAFCSNCGADMRGDDNEDND